MPNDGNRIYTETVNGVKYGVDVQNDIYKVLGIGPYNGEYYDVTWACINRHGKTNKWSKVKPIAFDSYEPISFDKDLTRVKGLIWGMKPPQMNSGDIYFNKMCYAIISGSNVYSNWVYYPPVADKDWSRASDFDGYNHTAPPVFTTGTSASTDFNLFDYSEIRCYLSRNPNSDFTMSEFMDAYLDYYFVVELYVENGAPFYSMNAPTYRFVSSNPIKDMDGYAEYLTIDVSQLDTSSLRDRYAYLCMGMQRIFDSGNPEPGTGIVAPWESIDDTPCCKRLHFTARFNRTLNVSAYNFGYISGSTWYPAINTTHFSFSGTRMMNFKCRMERKQKGIYILPQNSTYLPPGEKAMFIRGKASGSYTNEQYAKPSNESAQALQYVYVAPTTAEGEFTEFCLLFDNLLKLGSTDAILFEASVDNGKTWSMMTMVDVWIDCN